MKKLSIGDLCVCHSITDNNITLPYVDCHPTQTPSVIPSGFPKYNDKIILTNTKKDVDFLKEAITLLQKRNNKEFKNRPDLFNHPLDIKNLANTNLDIAIQTQKRLLSILISNDSNIRIRSRLGGFSMIIFPEKFKNVVWIDHFSVFNMYYSDLIEEIFVIRNIWSDNLNLILVENDINYYIGFLGRFEYNYSIINIRTKNEIRNEKFKNLR